MQPESPPPPSPVDQQPEQPQDPQPANPTAEPPAQPEQPSTTQIDPSLKPVTSGKTALKDIGFAAAGLLAAIVLGGWLLSRIRKGTLAASSPVDETETVMKMIKRLHASGEMSEEEYQATRKKLLGTMAKQFKESGTKPTERQDGRQGKRQVPPPAEPDAEL